METIMTPKLIIHLVCGKCYYDLAEWGVPLGVDRIPGTSDLFGYAAQALHIYRLRPIGVGRCDYDDHMYLANRIPRMTMQ
jgi:hypothetical protein